MANLDQLAAQHAQNIIASTSRNDRDVVENVVENVVTKSLGVIQEQGVFAGLLYLSSRPEREKLIARAIRDELVSLMAESDLSSFQLAYGGDKSDSKALLDHFAQTVCAKPVQTLLLVKSLFEQTLTYARYSVKARMDGTSGREDENEEKGAE